MATDQAFSEEQQQYLQGFTAGCAALRGVPTFAATLTAMNGSAPQTKPPGPEDVRQIHWDMQDRQIANGQKLCPEEQAKRKKDPFQMWDEMQANAAAGKFPKGTDVLLYKYHGLFYVAPAQDAFMCRLRFHGGLTNAHQFRGLADIAEQYAGGYADVTTRANLQLREIKAESATHVISSLLDLGIISRGSGADNIRNVTGSPTAGIDPQEIYDTRPLTKQMHHYILQHPEMYGLYDLRPVIDEEGQAKPVVIGMTKDARTAWKSFYGTHAEQMADLSGEMAAAFNKLEEAACHLALVLHYTRWAAGDESLTDDGPLDQQSMEAGIALCEWFKTETARVYSILEESPESLERRRLLEWIERKGGQITARDLAHGPRSYRGQPETAEAALNELVSAGAGTWECLATAGETS